MASSGSDIAQLTRGLELTRIRQIIMVAGLVLFAYDPLLTFEQEYKYIWKTRWAATRAIYLYLRYVAPGLQAVLYGKFVFGVDVSPNYCRKVGVVEIIAWVLVQELALLTIALRTSAIYQNRKSINVLLAVTYLLNLAGCLALSCMLTLHLEWTQSDNGLDFGCGGFCAGTCLTFLRTSCIPPAMYEALLCIMTVFKAVEQGDIFSTRLLKTLYRDGFVYFAAIFGLGSTQVVLFNLFPLSDSWLAIGGSFSQGIFRALVSIACCRLILNLRGVILEPRDSDTTLQGTSEGPLATSVHFAAARGTNTSATEYSTVLEVPTSLANRQARHAQNSAAGNHVEEFELAVFPRERSYQDGMP